MVEEQVQPPEQEQPPAELLEMLAQFKQQHAEATEKGEEPPKPAEVLDPGKLKSLTLPEMFRVILESEGEQKALAFLKEVNRLTTKPRSPQIAALKAKWEKKRKEKMIRQLGGK